MPLLRGLSCVLALAGAVVLAQACLPQAGLVAPTAPSGAEALRLPEVSPAVTADPTADPTAVPTAAVPIGDGYRIRLPRLGIDLPIAEGIVQRDIEQQRTPEGFAFHLPGTSIPGLGGNTYLYSHARVGMFLALWSARVGDEVLVLTPDGRALRYAVSEVRPRVAPTDVSVAQPSTDERLTLQTSTGPDPQDPRFVVIAVPRPLAPPSRIARERTGRASAL